MNAREILVGFADLQRHFPGKRTYPLSEIEAVWPQLLACSSLAFIRAIGSLKKGSRFLPRADYVLERTRAMQQSIGPLEELPPETGEDVGLVSIDLFTRMLRGEIEEHHYIDQLWRLSEQHRSAIFAVEALRLERKREGDGSDCRQSADFQ